MASDAVDEESAPVVVINEAVARRDFPGSNPIGRRVEMDEAGPRTIVGAAANAATAQWSSVACSDG